MNNNKLNAIGLMTLLTLIISVILFIVGFGIHLKHYETKERFSKIEESLKRIVQNNNYMGELK